MRDRVVVITGAAHGLGAALACRYGRAGAKLGLLDVDEKGVNDLAQSLSRGGVTCEPVACDVTSPEACEQAVARICDTFGGIDVLIVNAGITHLSEFTETDLSVIRRVMEVNFFGAVNITKAALPSLLERRGQVIAMSSVAGFVPLPYRTGYASSKYAVRGFFETLRTETKAQGLKVMVVCPSFVDTDIGTNALGGDGAPSTRDRPEATGAMAPSEVAKVIFLAAERGVRFLPVAKGARLSYLLSRISPRLLEWLSTRKVYGTAKH